MNDARSVAIRKRFGYGNGYGWTAAEAADILALPAPKLGQWARAGLAQPTVDPPDGDAGRPMFGFADLVVASLVADGLAVGVPRLIVKRVAAELRDGAQPACPDGLDYRHVARLDWHLLIPADEQLVEGAACAGDERPDELVTLMEDADVRRLPDADLGWVKAHGCLQLVDSDSGTDRLVAVIWPVSARADHLTKAVELWRLKHGVYTSQMGEWM